MSNKFEIQVVALDAFTNIFRRLNDNASRAVRPLVNVQRQVGGLSKELHLDAIAKGMGNVSRSSLTIARNLGAISGPMEALFGLTAAGSFAAAGAAIVGIGSSWGRLGFNIDRTSTAIGVSSRDLQLWRGAAGLAGVSADTLDAGLKGVGTTMQDAFYGRNPMALAVLAKLGIEMKRLKDGTPDVTSAMDQIANVMARIDNPYSRGIVARSLGIPEDLIPLLSKGSAGLRELRAEQENLGIASEDSLAKTKAFEQSIFRLKASGSALAMTFGEAVIPSLTRFTDWMNRILSQRGESPWSKPSGAGGAPSSGLGSTPIGLRQNNPGNLRSWFGVPSVNGFASFASPTDGLNAMAQQIGRYYNRDGLASISSIIGKYAPASENNTAAYIADVSKQTGFNAHEEIDPNNPKQLAPLLKAMVKHEQGRQPFGDDTYAQAAQSVKVDVHFANAPAGTRAKATVDGAWAPARISYAMPGTATP